MVHFQLPISLNHTIEPLSEIKELRELNKIDVDEFRSDIEASPLNSESSFNSLEESVDLYMDSLECLLDKHAPVICKKLRTNRSPWWNQTCQEARTKKRRAERELNKTGDAEAKSAYKEKCILMQLLLLIEPGITFTIRSLAH